MFDIKSALVKTGKRCAWSGLDMYKFKGSLGVFLSDKDGTLDGEYPMYYMVQRIETSQYRELLRERIKDCLEAGETPLDRLGRALSNIKMQSEKHCRIRDWLCKEMHIFYQCFIPYINSDIEDKTWRDFISDRQLSHSLSSDEMVKLSSYIESLE